LRFENETGGRRTASPVSGSGGCLLGFFAGLGIGLLLVHDPGVSEVEEFGHRE
jgi:hypothetical protein